MAGHGEEFGRKKESDTDSAAARLGQRSVGKDGSDGD